MIDLDGAGPAVPGCCLCAQIEGRAEEDLVHRLLGENAYVRRVAAESGRSAVIPSLGPLAPGHVLVCPHRHARSLAALEMIDRGDLIELADRTVVSLEALWPERPVHRFEHGDASRGNEISCSVEHAHLHLVPAAIDPWPALREELTWIPIDGIEELASLTKGREYLLYTSPEGQSRVHLRESKITSQFLRLRFAEALGNSVEWNWRQSPRAEATASTYELLRAALD